MLLLTDFVDNRDVIHCQAIFVSSVALDEVLFFWCLSFEFALCEAVYLLFHLLLKV